MLVIDRAQHRHLAPGRGDPRVERRNALGREVDCRATRYDEIEQVALAERRLHAAQQEFLEPRELRETEGETRVVAQRAKVAEVIRDALEFECERAEPRAAHGNRQAGCTFEGLAVGPRVGDGGVARDTRREPVALGESQLGEPALDSLVYVTEALLQPEYLFAHHRETEMPGLDGPGMYGSHRDLVHSVAFHPHERVRYRRGERAGRCRRTAQRHEFRWPRRVPQPGPRIGIGGTHPAQVARCALHPARRRVEILEARVFRCARRNGQRDDQQCGFRQKCRTHRRSIPPLRVRPEREQSPATCGEVRRDRSPGFGRDLECPGSGRSGQRSRLCEPALEAHLTDPR